MRHFVPYYLTTLSQGDKDMNPQLTAALLAGVAGLVPLVANLVISAVQSRSRRSQRNDAISLAKQRVEFLNSWIKAHQAVSAPDRLEAVKQIAYKEMDDIRDGLQVFLRESHPLAMANRPAAVAARQQIDASRRWFLLYRPYSVAGWVWHSLFYMFSLCTLSTIALAFISILSGGYDAASTIVSLLALIIYVIPVAIVRLIAGYVDKRAQQKLLKAPVVP